MADFGITSEGVSVPRLIDYLDAIDASYLGDTGIDLDSTNPDNARDVLVRLNGYMAALLEELGEQLQAVVDLLDPDAASGQQLTTLARIVGVERARATRSLVTITITGTPGTQIGVGQLTARGGGRNGVVAEWSLTEDVTIPAGGSVDAVFSSDEPGAIPAEAGAVDEVATPLGGVDSVTNAAPAAVGIDEETDGALRIRMRLARASRAGCGIPGIRSRILNLRDSTGALFVQDCLIIANGDSEPATIKGVALGPNSYLVVVLPDPLTVEQQQLVLGALYDSVVGTARSAGTDVDGTVTNLADGTNWPVSFDYGEDLAVTVAIGSATAVQGYSAADVREAVDTEIQKLLPRALGQELTLLEVCGAVQDSGAVRSLDTSSILINGVNSDLQPTVTQRIASLATSVNGVSA